MTYYEKLGVSKYATQKEIKEAYKKLIKKYHPDIYQGDKSYAEKMTKELNMAYETLSDTTKKAEYDEEIAPVPKYQYTPPKYDRPPTDYNSYRKNYDPEYNYYYRYADYHRNKVPNSDYTNTESSKLEKTFIKAFDSNKSLTIILILVIYFSLLAFTIFQFYAIKSNYYSEKDDAKNISNTVQSQTNTTSKYNNGFPSNYENFDINNYFSDSELYDIYINNYTNNFDSFSEFKEYISQKFFEYYSEYYY